MNTLHDQRWLYWKSTKEAWDKGLIETMSNDEKMKLLGRPVYALYQKGYPVDYAAFYFLECEDLYPSWMVDRSMEYYERKFYQGLRAIYNDMVVERNAILKKFLDEDELPKT